MPAIGNLGGALVIGPQRLRPAGVEAAPIQPSEGVQPAAGDAVRAIEPAGESRGGVVDRRAEDNRRGRSAFDELRRTLAGQDDPVALSDAGRQRSRSAAADVFEQAFGRGTAEAGARADRVPRRFDELFARSGRRAALERPGDDRPTERPPAADAPPPERAPVAPPGVERRPDGAGGLEAVDTGDAPVDEATDDAGGAEAADGAEEVEGPDGEALSAEELEQVRELEARDAEVRTHEQAHKSVGGRYAGAISYDYQTGPDGQRYAVGGEVSIDISEVPGDPQATIQKMDVVRRAALAPAEPSGADRSVAATASQIASRARVELTEQQAEEAAEAREEAAETREEAEGPPPDASPAPEAAAPEGSGFDGSRIRRVSPGEGAGIFVARDRGESLQPEAERPPGPTVAALRVTG